MTEDLQRVLDLERAKAEIRTMGPLVAPVDPVREADRRGW